MTISLHEQLKRGLILAHSFIAHRVSQTQGRGFKAAEPEAGDLRQQNPRQAGRQIASADRKQGEMKARAELSFSFVSGWEVSVVFPTLVNLI